MKTYIVQRRLTHYRVPFFTALRAELAIRDIQLELLVGRGTAREESKKDVGHLSWCKPIPTHYFAGERLCWQPVRRYCTDADLIILTQENKLLQNHLLLLGPRKFKLAFWGHGANLQSKNPRGMKEKFKKWTTNRVDWWFAYTDMSANLIKKAGFPESRITVVDNAIDTTLLQEQKASVTDDEKSALLRSLGFNAGPVGVFVGSLYEEKRLDFLLLAAEAIREHVPNFQLLLVGDGPEREKVRAWCSSRHWARWVGARLHREKAAYISLGSIMLNPGLVGLGVLDSFACQVPILTTDCGIHSPEVAYLKSNINGVMTSDNLQEYVQAAAHLLSDGRARELLSQGCKTSAERYTTERMAWLFAAGIHQALSQERR